MKILLLDMWSVCSTLQSEKRLLERIMHGDRFSPINAFQVYVYCGDER